MKKNPAKNTATPRVFIRPLKMHDCAGFVAAVRRSRKLHGSWVTPKARTRGEFTRYIERFDGERRHGFLVVERASNELVGMININDVIRGAFQSASLGYYAFSPHAGRGLMAAGMWLALNHAFKKLKLHRLEANIQPGNRASIALVKTCGFVKEGFSRRMLKVCGQWRDHERWAILADDFRSNKKVRAS